MIILNLFIQKYTKVYNIRGGINDLVVKDAEIAELEVELAAVKSKQT